MAEVLLFHHAQGQTAGFLAFADALRHAGHTVHTPDLFDGRTFAGLDDGVAYAEEIGFDTVIDRGVAAAAGLTADLVYAGFSLGVLPAQKLAQTRPGALGAVLIHSCVSLTMFSPSWPDGVPVRIYAMEADPFFVDDGDSDAARDLISSAADATLTLYLGNQHLFADNSLPSYDAVAASSLMRSVLHFLASVDSKASA
jgi:dienelactone hydrolase